MNKIAILTSTILLLLCYGSLVAAGTGNAGLTSTSTSSSTNLASVYCGNIFSTSQTTVTNVFATQKPDTGLISLCLLIVLGVLLVLSVVYGIGVGFGINKLVEFAKAEYLESFFNVILIIVIAGGLASIAPYSSFFSNLVSISSTTTSQAPSGTQALYTGICANLVNGQIFPSVGAIAALVFNQIFYTAIASLNIGINFYQASGLAGAGTGLGLATSFIPNISLTPLQGLALYNNFVIFELAPLFAIFFLGIVVIFLFYIIFFLFPIFLYLGILLRSFPWTRAAGGSLLALFISFYIVFPALYAPFSAYGVAAATAPLSSSASQYASCILQSTASSSSNSLTNSLTTCTAPNTIGTYLLSILPNLGNSIGFLLTGGGQAFINAVDVYLAIIGYSILKLLGLAIAIAISFDLLEALGDLLGSPSLQSRRLLERLV